MHGMSLLVLSSVLLPGIVVANIGVPMLALLWPAQWIALLPMVMLEGELGHRRLNLPRTAALKVALVANSVSTCIGVPLTWAAMLALEFGVGAGLSVLGATDSKIIGYATFPLRSAWLDPTDDAWRVYLAFAVLAVPCCLASIHTEFSIARRMLAAAEPLAVRAWIRRANLLSYLLLLLATAAFPVLIGGAAW